MNYHNSICHMLLGEPDKLGTVVGFDIDSSKSRTAYKFGGGDIDVYLVSGDGLSAAVIEVKSNSTMRSKFERKQLPKYKSLFRLSSRDHSFYLVEGNTKKTLIFDEITFTHYEENKKKETKKTLRLLFYAFS